MKYHKKYFRMKIQESSVLNETTVVVRFRNGVLHLIDRILRGSASGVG